MSIYGLFTYNSFFITHLMIEYNKCSKLSNFRSSLCEVCTVCICHFVRKAGVQNFKTIYCIAETAEIFYVKYEQEIYYVEYRAGHTSHWHHSKWCMIWGMISTSVTDWTRISILSQYIATDRALFHLKNADIFLITPWKHILWVLIRSALVRHF